MAKHQPFQGGGAGESLPRSFIWGDSEYEICVTGVIIIYDDPATAEEIAAHLGTYAKHAEPRFKNSGYTTFSIVRLP